MMCYQMKSETEQLNLRADIKIIERLQKLADKFNKKSRTQVAVEIIEQYIDFWEQTELVKARAIQKQRHVLLNEGELLPRSKKTIPHGVDKNKKNAA